MLLVACGALPFPPIPGALTFRGPADIEMIEHLLEEIVGGDVRSVAFVIPWGAVWSLPAYELALLTAAHLRRRGLGASISLVTPEAEPLQLFDHLRARPRTRYSRARERESPCVAYRVRDGEPELIPDGRLPADRVVALPRFKGAPIDGLPQTVYGFIPVDAHAGSTGRGHFAAGDITSFTVKQGGIATQQADVAAAAIAAEADVSRRALPAGPAWAAAHGGQPALPPPRGHSSAGTQSRSLGTSALVASREDRRPPPGTFPRLTLPASRSREAGAPHRRVPRVQLEARPIRTLSSWTVLEHELDEHDGGVEDLMSRIRLWSHRRTRWAKWPSHLGRAG